MNQEILDLLRRKFLATLLQSDLSGRDLMEIEERLRQDSSFQKSFSILLADALQNFRSLPLVSEVEVRSSTKKTSDMESSKESIAELISKLASQKKMSKDRMIVRMNRIDPKIRFSENLLKAKMREIIYNFVEKHSSIEAKKLLDSISTLRMDEGDAYLTGITKRRTF